MFEKEELLEEKLELQREDFYQKGRFLAEHNESIEALNEYKDSCIKFYETKKELDDIRERLRKRPKYETVKYWASVFEKVINKVEKTFTKTK